MFLATYFDLFIILLIFIVTTVVAYGMGAKRTDRKYIVRLEGRAQWQRYMRDHARRFGTPSVSRETNANADTTVLPVVRLQDKYGNPDTVNPRYEATEELQYRAHA